ncbi:cohesin domain-containing protein [Patescibacteria group bacterium]|nr:cohesin domain-containing protein [Patescibacteria group bacterium]
MLKNNLKFFLLLFLTLVGMNFVSASPALAESADLIVSPLKGEFAVGQEFSVKVLMKNGGKTIDAVRANLNFPAELLEVKKVMLSRSFPVMSGGNFYDNEKGTISWGGAVYRGLEKNSIFAEIVFRVKKIGNARVDFSPGTKMLFNGIDIPFNTGAGNYVLATSAQPFGLKSIETPAKKDPSIKNTYTVLPGALETMPLILGKTNVPGALVRFDIDNGLYSEEIKSDSLGKWHWYLPEDLAAGRYSISIMTIDEKDFSNRINHETNVSVLNASSSSYQSEYLLAGIIPEKYQRVKPSDEMSVEIKLSKINNENEELKTIVFDYIIRDSAGAIAIHEKEERDLKNSAEVFEKSFILPKGLSEDKYIFEVSANYNASDIIKSYDNFKIFIPSGYFRVNVVIVILVVIIIALILVMVKIISRKLI